jgi:predicted nucleic acid-binding protein
VKRYWDSSALVDAFFDSRIEKQLFEPDQWTRPHSLAEMFSTLTSGKLGKQFLPDDAAAIVRELTAGVQFVELTPDEMLVAFDAAQKRGVRGGRVHDWLHAQAAKKAGVAELLTDNLTDFQGLEDGFTITAP